MDLRHNQLPWSDQIWAKIHADLAQALSQSRRVRAPFEVFSVPSSQQTVMADNRDDDHGFKFADTQTTPIVEVSVTFTLSQAQVHNEGENFFSLDRILGAAHELGCVEDELIMNAGIGTVENGIFKVSVSAPSRPWDSLYYNVDDAKSLNQNKTNWPCKKNSVGLSLFDAVNDAKSRLRLARRHEPFALFLSYDLEGEINSTIRGSNSLNTPVERLKPLVTAGIHSTPSLPARTAVVCSSARSWVDIAQALEPSVQFLNIGDDGEYRLRLIERFAFRLKDRSARIVIHMK